jgi:F-type H+-transporting ATPase subunit b
VVSIEPGLLLVQFATFGFAVFLLWRLFWKPLTRFMAARRRSIEEDIETAQQSRAAASEMEEQLRRRLAEIDTEAGALIRQATDEGKRAREDTVREAQTEARRLIESAGRQIAEEKARAIRELRAETVTLATLMAEKALRQSLDPKQQERLVDEFAHELDHG